MKIGWHVSIAGGIENAPQRAHALGCECFQIFSRSPHGGKATEITPAIAKKLLARCVKYKFDAGKDYVIHSPYYINLASTNNRIYYGSISALRKELEVATLIKAPYVITHIGSSKDIDGNNVQKKINDKVMKALRKIYEEYKGSAILLLEIAAGSGNIIGDSFEEIGYFIKTAKENGIKLGFCFDTCHSFAAGYDMRTAVDVKKLFKQMDKSIGLHNLNCIHFNDSQGALDSHIDRHEHIGQGQIGSIGLQKVLNFMNDHNINVILETKQDKVKEDLALVKSWLK